MQEININKLVNEFHNLNKNISNDIIIIGNISELSIVYKYDQLDLSNVVCNEIIYYNQEGESIKNHILPNSLKGLDCSDNKLTFLPNLPDSLQNLYCFNNKLMSLPNLPDSLQILNCHANKLTLLPNLPNSLKTLCCPNNKLISLPNLPDLLQKLLCYNNKLISLPNLPNSLEFINFGNININKLEYNPDYKNIKYKFTNSKITVGDYIIESKEDYVSYMKDYEKYLFNKVKSARN